MSTKVAVSMSRNQCLLRYWPVNVWVGILGDQILGPVALPNRLTGAVYYRFLVNGLPELMEHVPLHQRQHIWFTHDLAPPHFLRTLTQHLNKAFGEQWIGCEGPVNWHAWSPGFNSLDFWLLGAPKSLVYSTPISDIEVLQQRVQMPVRTFGWNQEFSTKYAPLCEEKLKVVLECMGTKRSICCRDDTNFARISAGIGFWTYVDWAFYAHLNEYCTPLKPVTLFFNPFSLRSEVARVRLLLQHTFTECARWYTDSCTHTHTRGERRNIREHKPPILYFITSRVKLYAT
jgi:hypothetical protein